MNELKPCPFCGGEAYPIGRVCYGNMHSIRCTCGVTLGYYATEAEAIKAWNTRAERTCRIERPKYIDPVAEPPDIFCEFVCSNCGGWIAKRFDYCPHCGAKVVE